MTPLTHHTILKMSESKDYHRKASQWAFTLPSFSTNDIVHLSALISSEILSVAFAICDDDTGNCYVQGFVKTSKRLCVGGLVRPMGMRHLQHCQQQRCPH